MKKKLTIIFCLVFLFSIFIVFSYVIDKKRTYSLNTSSTVLYQLSNPVEICQAIGNKSLKVYVEDINNNSFEAKMQESDCSKGNYYCCSNTIYYNNNLKNYTTANYEPWVAYHIGGGGPYYVEGRQVDNSLYDFFNILNTHVAFDENGKLKRLNTLRNGETPSLEVNLSTPIAINEYNDLRLSFDYSYSVGYINLTEHNSLSVYVYDSNNNKYGPYYIDTQEIKEVIYTKNIYESIRYNIVSENLLKNIPKNTIITRIKMMPYDNYRRQIGSFRIYNLSVSSYKDGYHVEKNTIKLQNAENTIRHGIVNRMVENATLKWTLRDGMTINYYSTFTNRMATFNSSTAYYGLPYINNTQPTLQMFINHTQRNNNNAVAYYSYLFPSKHKDDITTYDGSKTFKAGETIGNTSYIYENPIPPANEADLKAHDYILNNKNYFIGMDCTSSVFSSIAENIPYVYINDPSRKHWSSNEVKMLGNLELSEFEIEKSLRDNNTLSDDEEIFVDTIDEYYSSVFKMKYTEQQIYNAYAETIPGDVVVSRNHSRVVSGYPYVKCNDGTNTTDYTFGFCDKHGGINGDESYVITTEILVGHQKQGQRSLSFDGVRINGRERFVNETQARWNITLNSDLTDLTRIEDYLDVNGGFVINLKYYFKDLLGDYGNTKPVKQKQMYMAFRYKTLQEIADTGEVALLKKELIHASDYNMLKIDKALKGTFITNYIIEEIKYEINGNTYFDYPEQTNTYSFYYDMDEEIKDKIANIDYSEPYTLKVSVKAGPSVIYGTNGSDSNGFATILSLSSSNNSTIKSKKYTVDNNYINKIPKNTYISAYLENLDINNYYDIKIFNSNNTQLNGSNLIFTGSLTKVFYNDIEVDNFTNIVTGDTNGDGNVNVVDVAKLFQHYRKTNIIPDNQSYYVEAGNVVNDDGVKLNDIAKLFQYVRGTISNLN